MPKPKVSEEKRQRTAQACETCKRRKQRCNGCKPCSTCTKKNLPCEYANTSPTVTESRDDSNSPPKRRRLEDIPDSTAQIGTECKQEDLSQVKGPAKGTGSNRVSGALVGVDEDPIFMEQTRLLADSGGRLIFIGGSATLSFLSCVRMIVEGEDGCSEFTNDPNRHNLMETVCPSPDGTEPAHMLPDREIVEILVQSYFTHTHGLVEVLEHNELILVIEKSFKTPLSMSNPEICLLDLVMAIGLVLAKPETFSRAGIIIESLRLEAIPRAELFFRHAKYLLSHNSSFESLDLWSIQALSLMAVYAMVVSRRNTAYFYLGMACRSAISMGLHRVYETNTVYGLEEGRLRRNIWRSLFVLDQFLAASLGRPPAISEDDIPDDSLRPHATQTGPDEFTTRENCAIQHGIDAAVRASQIIGMILKKIYSRQKVSSAVALTLSDECKDWIKRLPHNLHTRRLYENGTSPSEAVGIVHAHLLGLYAVILLTRPFFLYCLKVSTDKQDGARSNANFHGSMISQFAEACVTATTRSIAIAQTAFKSGLLSQRDPFSIYFLFSAALVVMSNEFGGLFGNVHYTTSISMTMNIMSYCATKDPQANRFLFILKSFQDIIDRRAQTSGGSAPTSSHRSMLALDPWTILPPSTDYQRRSSQYSRSHMADKSGGISPLSNHATQSPKTTDDLNGLKPISPNALRNGEFEIEHAIFQEFELRTGGDQAHYHPVAQAPRSWEEVGLTNESTEVATSTQYSSLSLVVPLFMPSTSNCG